MPRLTAEDYVVLPAGEYRAILKDIGNGPDTYGPTYKFFFEITDDLDYSGETITALASATFTPKSKLRRWVESLTGRTFEPGDVFDTDTLLHMPCRLTLEERVTPDGIFNRVLALMPAERATRSARRSAPHTQAQQPAPRPHPSRPPAETPHPYVAEAPPDLFDEEPPPTSAAASKPSRASKESAIPVDEIPF